MAERDWLLPGHLWRGGTGLVECLTSRAGGDDHVVTVSTTDWHGVWCDCRGFAYNRERCQHLVLGGLTAQIWVRVLKLRADGTMSPQSVLDVSAQIAHAATMDSSNQRAMLRSIRDGLMSWRAASEG